MIDKGVVLVSGASGYVASHIIKLLLQSGYKVVGTGRDTSKTQKYQFLYDFPHAKQNLELRSLQILSEASWDNALKNVNFIIHVASPIPPGVPKDQNQLIIPAKQGTRQAAEAAYRNKIKRIVFTSSCLTVCIHPAQKISTQEDWSDINFLHHYPKSKYLAQKIFWQCSEKYKQSVEFVSVLPSLVTGPAFIKHGNSSQAFVSQILNGGYPGIPSPSITFALVDVRDVAVGHVKALQYKQAQGKRYIISGYKYRNDEVFQLLRSKYQHLGYKIPKNPIDAEGIKQSGHGPSLRVLGFLGKKFVVDNARSIKELGMTYRGAQESILQQAQRQIHLGIVKKSQ